MIEKSIVQVFDIIDRVHAPICLWLDYAGHFQSRRCDGLGRQARSPRFGQAYGVVQEREQFSGDGPFRARQVLLAVGHKHLLGVSPFEGLACSGL